MKYLFLILLSSFIFATQAEEVRFKNPIFYGPLTNKNKVGTYEYYITPTSVINKAYDETEQKCDLIEDTGSRVLLKCLNKYNKFYYLLLINTGSRLTPEKRKFFYGEDKLPSCLIQSYYEDDLDKIMKGEFWLRNPLYATDTLNNECGIYEDFKP